MSGIVACPKIFGLYGRHSDVTWIGRIQVNFDEGNPWPYVSTNGDKIINIAWI